MKNFCIAFCIALIVNINPVFGSETGMPQLNPEFWVAQIFWLILIFSSLYLIVWKVFLPRITYSIENRKSRIVKDLDEAQKLKDSAEKKLKEYNKIVEDSKNEAKKILEDIKKKLDDNIKNKKEKFNEEIEKELISVENEIKDLNKSSESDIKKISEEISSEIVKKLIGTEINKSNLSAIVEDVYKQNKTKHI